MSGTGCLNSCDRTRLQIGGESACNESPTFYRSTEHVNVNVTVVSHERHHGIRCDVLRQSDRSLMVFVCVGRQLDEVGSCPCNFVLAKYEWKERIPVGRAANSKSVVE